MHLSTLPTELLISIANHLLSAPQDLNSLAQTSHLLYRITNPILYKDQISNQKSSALLWAAERGKPAPCSRLLSEGANPNIKDQHKRTPLSWAAGNGHADVVSILLSTVETDANTPDAYFQTPLCWAAGNSLRSSSRIPLAEPSRETPLAVAASEGAESIVEELLHTRKVDPSSRDRFGQVPLIAAARNGHLGIFKRLIGIEGVEADARSHRGHSALLAAAGNGYAEIVKLLLAIPNVDLNQQDAGTGDSALIAAVTGGHVDVVNLLLANEVVDPNLANEYGDTALLRAVHQERNHIMHLLLARGVDPDVKNKQGNTPLMIAAHKGNIEAVEGLLSTGRIAADLNLKKLNLPSFMRRQG
ncbi:hypothetical protein N7453_010214 [Penicillium expansum]|nr:hypothetical protein N7453_010214 [Penicillium expansum]